MIGLNRTIILLVCTFLCCPFLQSQDLEYLPPVLNKKQTKDNSVSFLLNTMTNSFEGIHTDIPYVNSVQIVDANQSWPPRWYSATPVYKSEEFHKDSALNQRQFNFIIDAKVEGGYLSFFKLVSLCNDDGYIKKDVQGYIMLNKSMEPVDTVGTSIRNTGPYWHDFRINEKGERLIDLKLNQKLDLRKATGNPEDSAYLSSVDEIQILNKENKIVFTWVSTEKLDPNVFQFKESITARSFAPNKDAEDLIDWSHLTSAIWDYDGNILYSLRFIGIGKIDRTDGHVIWKIDFKDLPMISGKDTLMWAFPHDLELIAQSDTSATYSLYSLGLNEQPSRGVVFEVNKKTNKAKLLKYVFPKKVFHGQGQGSFDYLGKKEHLFSYGVYSHSPADSANACIDEAEYIKGDTIAALIQVPQNVLIYKIHKIDNWPLPVRPEITLHNGLMEAKGSSQNWTWYELSGKDFTKIKQVGTGQTFKPEARKTYCVAGKLGIGYVVSNMFTN